MLDSTLNRSRRTIVLDRCLSRNSKDLLTDESAVKRNVNEHFQKAAGTTHENKVIPKKWSSIYNPISDIDPNIYKSLMSPPTADEWYNVIKSLADGKAPGPSKIHNEMLKHLGPLAKKLFWHIICGCLKISSLPNRWNLAYVYPIPKPKP